MRRTEVVLAAACGIAVLLVVALLPPVQIVSRPYETDDDIHYYESIAHQLRDGDVPYRDFPFEYPPLALVPIALPAVAIDSYQDAFRLVMLSIYAVGIALVAVVIGKTGGGRARLLTSCVGIALAPLALPTIFFGRFDAWPAVLLVAAMAALTYGRRVLSAGLLGVGTVAKIFPVVALPGVLLTDQRDRSRVTQTIAAFLACVVLVLLPFVLVGRAGAEHAFSTLVRRPLHLESLGGSLLLGLQDLGFYGARTYVSFGGSADLAGGAAAAVAVVQAIALVAALALVWLLFARGSRSIERTLTATAASVAVLVALGKVLSPQFLIWLVLVVPLVERRLFVRAFALVGVALVLTRAYFPYRYERLFELEGHVAWILVLRNLVLLALAVYLVVSLRERRS